MALFDKYLKKPEPTPTPVSVQPQSLVQRSPCGRLLLRRVYFCCDKYKSWKNSDGTYKIMNGWVVIGFIGSVNNHYIIPKTYDGLPIIGIFYDAYEKLNEYDKVKTEGCYKYKLETNVFFYSDNMLFVMPPRRYNDRKRMIVNYFVNDAREKKGTAFAYKSCSFCYDDSRKSLLSDIIRVTGKPMSCGYFFLGFESDRVVTYKHVYMGLEQIYREKSDLFAINLSAASVTTMKSCGLYWNGKKDWDCQWVGKYYRLYEPHPNTNENMQYFSKNDMDAKKAVLAFTNSLVDVFAYNMVKGMDVTINSDNTPFPGR